MNRIVTIAQAREAGLPRYFTGMSCRHGHVSERFVSSRKCIVCSMNCKAEWAANNKDRISQYNQTYLIENRRNIYDRHNENRRKNPERAKAQRAADYQKHKDDRISTMRAWREANPDKVKAAHRAKTSANPERYASYKRNYKLRKRSAEGSHTGADIIDILRLQKGRCACCREKIDKYHVDHIVPLKSGGSNSRRNLQILCAPCNQSKSARDPTAFMRMRGMLL